MDDISKFLPPGFNPDAPQPPPPPPPPATTTTTTSTEASTETSDFKLDLSKLFSNVATDAALLPPGYNAEAAEAAETEAESTTTEKIALKFPTRPGGVKKVEKPSKPKRPAGPPAFVPKIKSFQER